MHFGTVEWSLSPGGIGMILKKLDPITGTAIQEKGIEFVVDWVDVHKQYFYTLGCFYVQNQLQMEELFYRFIGKVHKDWPKYKGNDSHKMWMTANFILSARELSREDGLQGPEDSRQDQYKAIAHLKMEEKEALILTHVAGFSLEEAAQILGMTVGKIKGDLYAGIQSVRNELYGKYYHGCEEYQTHYIDYLLKSMDRPAKIEFEVHLYHCPACQADLASFQEVMMFRFDELQEPTVPSQFLDPIKKKLTEKKEQRKGKNKKRKKWAVLAASVFAFVIALGFITGVLPKVYYAVAEENEQLRPFLQQGFGKRLNLEAENADVLIKINGVVADDIRTLVFYEIHALKEDKQYFIHFEDGISVENEFEIMKTQSYPLYSTLSDNGTGWNNETKKNTYYGKVSLNPLKKEEGLIKLRVTKIQEWSNDPELKFGFLPGENKTGHWSFEFSATKQPSKEYKIEQQKKIEGVPIRIDKLIIAPTTTILQYAINSRDVEKRIDMVNFRSLNVNNKKVEADQYGGYFIQTLQDNDWVGYQTYFDPVYGEKPKKVRTELESVYLSVSDQKTIDLGGSQPFPRTIHYAGSDIAIDKVKNGQLTNVVITNKDLINREYESIQFGFQGGSTDQPSITNMESNGVLMDKNGVEYDDRSGPIDFEKIEQPRYFVTEQTLGIEGFEKNDMKLEIIGYNTMKYVKDDWNLAPVQLLEEKE